MSRVDKFKGDTIMLKAIGQNRLKSLALVAMCCSVVSFQSAAVASDKVRKAGDILQILIPAVGFGSTLFYEEGYDGSIQFVKALAASQVTTEVLKRVTHKQRPDGSGYKSFPSGHATKSFMGASFIHKRYGWKYSIPAYIGATYVGYSRVHADKHYVEDVLAGAAIGIISSFYFTEPYKGVTITPTAEDGAYGINITKKW